MDYHLLHPLFDDSEEDYDIAIDYMANSMLGTGSVKVGVIGDDGEPIIDQQKVREITKRFIASSYGKNLKTIANAGLVEEVFFDKYADSILKYLKYAGYEAFYVELMPHDFSRIAIESSIRKNKNFKGYMPWNPNIIWNDFSYGDNIEKNIVNPINQYENVSLIIKGVTNLKFLEYLYGINKQLWDKILEEINNGNTIDAVIKILPQFSYERIFNTVNLIHKYF